MVSRLRTALADGISIEGADASFYIRELSESTMMSRGLDYSTAHQGAPGNYEVSPYSVYHPDVINAINAAEPGSFIPNWL